MNIANESSDNLFCFSLIGGVFRASRQTSGTSAGNIVTARVPPASHPRQDRRLRHARHPARDVPANGPGPHNAHPHGDHSTRARRGGCGGARATAWARGSRTRGGPDARSTRLAADGMRVRPVRQRMGCVSGLLASGWIACPACWPVGGSRACARKSVTDYALQPFRSGWIACPVCWPVGGLRDRLVPEPGSGQGTVGRLLFVCTCG